MSIGETLAEVDTDKATMEMQALAAGVLRKILVQAGETVPLGQIVAIVGAPDEDISALIDKAAGQGGASKAATSGNGAPQVAAKTGAEDGQAQPVKGEADRQDGRKQGASADPPTSDGLSEQRTSTDSSRGAAPQAGSAPGNGQRQTSERIIISPLAARMAAEAGINLQSLRGSGPGGRIVKRDIETAISQGAQPAAAPEAAAPVAASYPRAVEAPAPQPVSQSSVAGASPYRDEQMSEMRRTIARRLTSSIGPVPHFFLTTEIEMDRAVELRRSINELDPNLKVSINDLIIKVAAVALIEHPQVNASFQDRVLRYYERADIGVAVAIEEGLITPVVRSADQKSVGQIGREVRDMAERARARKLRPEEYTNATFSVSNLGMFGIDEFTAVINPPEAAILAVGTVQPKPVVRGTETVVRQMMRVTMSCDHRVIDGATGAKFLQSFKKILENPLYLMTM